MSHVAFVPLTGFRLREQEMAALGMSLPGLGARATAVGQLPALGLLTLAGALPDEWSCSYHPVDTVSAEQINEIVATRPDLVAVLALTASVQEAYELSRRLRQEGITTIIGGLHATTSAAEASQHFDCVVTGNAESIWPTILADHDRGELRMIYKAADTPGSHQRFSEPEKWPLPRFDLLGDRPHRFTLQTQKGCPFACEFCGASRLLGRFTEKPAARIRDELAAITAIRRRPLIELADDNTFAGSRSSDELLQALSDSGARWFTEADWRIGERPDVLQRLAESGCLQVLMGIESVVFRYPGMGQKQSELARIVDATEAIQAAGVAVNACFIVGADGETRESIDRLVDFIERSPFAEVQLTLQTPFPGTALYQRLQRSGRLIDNRDWSFYTLFDVTYQPDQMTVEELEAGFRSAVSRVFNNAACDRRAAIREEIWSRGFSKKGSATCPS